MFRAMTTMLAAPRRGVERSVSATRLSIALLWLGCLALGSVPGQTLSPHKVMGRYQQFIWQDQHGLPQNGVTAIARTRDGYLWVGTFEGAARFDGVRFTVFDSSAAAELGSSQILALLEDRAGDLWLGTNGGGLTRRTGERFQRYSTREGLSNDHVRCLLQDRDGSLWIGTDDGLTLFRDGRFSVYTTKDGLPDDHIWALAEDSSGGLWVGTGRGLVRFRDGRFDTYTTKDGLPPDYVISLLVDRAGNLWVGTNGGGLCRFRDNRFFSFGAELARARVSVLYEDRAGILWVGTRGAGLIQIEGDRVRQFSIQDGLPSDTVLAIQQDPEGSLWVGTEDAGLCQLRAGRFQVYNTQDGLPHDFATAIFEDSAGSLWMGTLGGLGRLKDGRITAYTTRDGLPDNGGGSVAEDHEGNLWFNTRGKLCRYRDGRFVPRTLQNGLAVNKPVSALLGDRAGNLWIGTHGTGLNLFRDNRYTVYTTRDGLAGDNIMTLYEDQAGSLWIGTLSGLSRFKDNRFTTWTTRDGLPSNHILSLYGDRQGNLWIGTSGGGLCRLRDGKFATITVKDGLYDNLAFQILSDTDDDSGDLWMSGNRGIYRVGLKELNDFAEGRIASVTSFAYGAADGMLSRECNGASPAGWRTRDGQLWFPTVRGVVAINPRQRDSRPPLVAVEGATLDREAVSAGQSVRIRPGQENLEIRYTALNWSRPHQVRFKYQMLGLDHDWVEAGARRTAYYSHLPPGDYTFKVIADNGEGVWNTQGRSLRIVVLPPFYRTWWFLTLAVLFAGGIVFAAYEYRVLRLKRAGVAQQAFSRQLIESQEDERKRIAAELHDSLGQQLLVIKNWAVIGLGTVEKDHQARETLDEISTTASQAVSEVREIIYDLRPYQLDKIGLANTIRFMIEKVAASSDIRFGTEVGDVDNLFAYESEITLYRIVQECVNNIVKHSGASEARVVIERHGRTVSLTIEDNGRGFVPEATRSEARRGGFGLTGIAERVLMLGGRHTIHSASGGGTKIHISIELEEGK